VSNAWLARQAEKASIGLAHRIIVVSDEQKQRMDVLGAGGKTHVVMNAVDLSFLEASLARVTPEPQGGFTIIYTGILNSHRGLDTVISAMPLVRQSIPSSRLKVVGDGNSRFELERLTKRLDLSGCVDFVGWVDVPEMYRHIQLANLGIIPHRRNPHTDSTIPNKLFDYMALAKPVVASDLTPLERIISETGCGRTFRAEDPDSCARALIECSESSLACALGENGRRAVVEKYNWHVAGKALMELYESL
jgi:glycosyltransferase involved in cell wall biosynthesis